MGRHFGVLRLCLGACLVPAAASLSARASGAAQQLNAGESSPTSPRLHGGQLAAGGRVSGNWHLCEAPIVATKAGPKTGIPRILHQTYKSKVALPAAFEKSHKTWVEMTPNWKHRIWLDHENRAMVKAHYPWFLDTYDSFTHVIQRVDAARIFMLHRFGGVYADMDIEAMRDPTPLFNGGHDLVFFYQLPPKTQDSVIDTIEGETGKPRLGTIANAFMASKPGHPFWIYLAELIVKSRNASLEEAKGSDIPNMDIYMTTGPSMLSRALAEYQVQHPEVTVAIFSKKYWSPFSWGLKEDPCEVHWECRALYPEAYVVSHWTRSWVFCQRNGTKLVRKRLCMAPVSMLQMEQLSETILGEAGNSSWCP